MSLYSETSPEEPEVGNIEKRARRASAARHARKCTVCHHKDREFIDQDYLRWLSPKKIAHEYAISHQSVVYRHADATGLRAQRRASLRATLENFIEQAESVRATAGSVVAAVRLYAQINDQGQWTPPVKRYIIEHRHVPAEGATPTPVPGVSNAADASPAATSAHSSHTKNDPENSHKRSSKGSADLAPTPGSAPKKDGVPPSNTFDAHPAAPQAQAHKNSDPVNATGSLQPVATITAGSAVPFSASPDKFPAVPVASINFASDLPISNREHVELEHAPTH
ncbi:MAG: hypothetical protein ABSB66_07140 [Candidatus Acidiferrales bacterium]